MGGEIKELANNIIEEYYDDDDFKKAYKAFLEILEVHKHHPEIVKQYLDLCYQERSDEIEDIENMKNCISLCEEILAEDKLALDPLDLLKIGQLYDELEDYDSAVKYYLEAEKHIEKKKHNMYADIAWYYDEIANDYAKAIEYYEKYLEHNRVWFGDNKDKAKNQIIELKRKLNGNVDEQ